MARSSEFCRCRLVDALEQRHGRRTEISLLTRPSPTARCPSKYSIPRQDTPNASARQVSRDEFATSTGRVMEGISHSPQRRRPALHFGSPTSEVVRHVVLLLRPSTLPSLGETSSTMQAAIG